MTVQIYYNNKDFKKTNSNLVLFVGDKFNIEDLNKTISNEEFLYISDLLKTSDLKKDILSFKVNSKKTIFLVSVKDDLIVSKIENLGAKFFSFIDLDKNDEYVINSESISYKTKNLVHRLTCFNYFDNSYVAVPKNV